MKSLITICFSFMSLLNIGQNIISNPSFSNVLLPNDTNRWFKIDFGKKSGVVNWYIPHYFNAYHKLSDEVASYCSSRNSKHHVKLKIFTNSEELFGENLGFVKVYTDCCWKGAIQQKLTKKLTKGTYCFKFKYKITNLQYPMHAALDFSFSSSSLKEYLCNRRLNLPDTMVQLSFNDSINNSTEIPWQQKSFIINLKGNENYLTIGALKSSYYNKNVAQNSFYIDDIELTLLNDSNKNCDCEKINKTLSNISIPNYQINILLHSDSLAIYIPTNPLHIESPLFTAETVAMLQKLIVYMQKNTTVKLKFIQYDQFNISIKPPYKPSGYESYLNYMIFYGITSDRITSEWGLLKDTKNEMYYGFNSRFIKMDFEFYYD